MSLDVKRLRELLAKASQGPWRAEWCEFTDGDTFDQRDADATLIAELRNAAPELLDRLERAEANEYTPCDQLRVADLEQKLATTTQALAELYRVAGGETMHMAELEPALAEARRVLAMEPPSDTESSDRPV